MSLRYLVLMDGYPISEYEERQAALDHAHELMLQFYDCAVTVLDRDTPHAKISS